ncbi:copper resistance protein CopC [Cryptosporangium japonicum]|uniref:Copper resistance protein CopC n=1 Tax=Cryptosporangium japonicum TaxID=80872 RepID=A0ABN0UJP9_9ACTN
MRAALVLLVGVLALLVAPPARAHSDLEGSSPKAGSTVTSAPEAVTLTFGEVIRGNFSTVVVTGPDGVAYSDGKPDAVDTTLTQPVKPLVTGEYTVAWRIVSADGHPKQGVFRFTADVPAAPSPSAPPSAAPTSGPAVAQVPSASPAAAERSTDGGGTSWLPWAVSGVVAVLALAGAAVLARSRRAS